MEASTIFCSLNILLLNSFYLAQSILPEELSIISTPKRLSGTPQAMSTPSSVPMSESAEALEAKAALKQV